MVDSACRRGVAVPAAVSPVTTGQPVMRHEVRLSLVNLR